MDVDQLTLDEQLSPELVLVLSPELRALAVARLGPPSWGDPRPRLASRRTPVHEPLARSLGGILMARVVQLGAVFVAVTVLTLAMSLVAHALP